MRKQTCIYMSEGNFLWLLQQPEQSYAGSKRLTCYGFSGSKITNQGVSTVLQAALVYVLCICVLGIYKIKPSCVLHLLCSL